MHFEVDRETDAALLESLRRDLLRVLGDVRAAVDDWEAMRDKALAIAGSLTDPDDAEAASLLRWMADDHFTFLGYRDAETGASLGISRGAEAEPSRRRPRRTHCEEGRRALHRAPTGPHGAGVRRTQRVPRPLDLRGVQHRAARHPAAAPQGRCGARPLRASPRLALREGPRIDPRHVPARRAVPDQRGRAVRDRNGDPEPPRAQARAALRAQRRARTVLLLPRLRAPRSVHDRARPAHRGDPGRRARRHRSREHRACLRVGARPTARDRDGARRRRRVGSRRARRSRPSSPMPVGRGPTTSRPSSRSTTARSAASTSCDATATRSRPRTARTSTLAARSATCSAWSR